MDKIVWVPKIMGGMEEITIGGRTFPVVVRSDLEYSIDEDGIVHTTIWIVPKGSTAKSVAIELEAEMSARYG